MTNRELLELAARAVGSDFVSQTEYDEETSGYKTRIWIREQGRLVEWNPLTDYGDALRLAVKLELTIYTPQTKTMQYDIACAQNFDGTIDCCEKSESDPYAATCRAIVCAAAAIGEQMK